MVEGILQGMRWLGLDWDEGPYHQTQRMEMYRESAAKLLASGHAYYCFCTKAGTGAAPRRGTAEGRPPRYEGTCRKISREEGARRRAAGESAAVRFAVPESGSTAFDDAVFGRVEFANTELEDFVLLRSDGGPTYHLSVVTDDVDMRISHIIRGADHISNTPKQVLLYQALGAALPVFAHVPLILGPDKTRLSKRHGATSVIAYRDEGIVPEAFRNFLALLGWTPPGSGPAGAVTEILGDQQLIQLFDLTGISHSNAVFDRAKLDWFNTEYIRAYPAEKLLAADSGRMAQGRPRARAHRAGLAARDHQSAQAARPQPERLRHILPRILHRHVSAGSRGRRKIPGGRKNPPDAGGAWRALRGVG